MKRLKHKETWKPSEAEIISYITDLNDLQCVMYNGVKYDVMVRVSVSFCIPRCNLSYEFPVCLIGNVRL